MSRSAHAFTFAELAIVVAVVGILAAIFVPGYVGASQDNRIITAAQQLERIANGFSAFRNSNGYWPPEIEAGRMPPEMRSVFGTDNPFAAPTPIGGVFDYDNLPDQGAVVISIRATAQHPLPTVADAMALDALIDDGNLRTGNFRAQGDGYAYAFNRR